MDNSGHSKENKLGFQVLKTPLGKFLLKSFLGKNAVINVGNPL